MDCLDDSLFILFNGEFCEYQVTSAIRLLTFNAELPIKLLEFVIFLIN